MYLWTLHHYTFLLCLDICILHRLFNLSGSMDLETLVLVSKDCSKVKHVGGPMQDVYCFISMSYK